MGPWDRRRAGQAPVEGWILAGTLDGRPAAPALLDDVAGVPHVLRHALTLVAAGVGRVRVLWCGLGAPPDLASVAADPRLGGRPLELVHAPPPGDPEERVLIARGDRIYHRDLPRTLSAAPAAPPIAVLRASGDLDALLLAPRCLADALVAHVAEPDGLRAELVACRRRGLVSAVPVPPGGFAVPAPDRAARARAERRLLVSLRKPVDGLASRHLNRHVSLAVTRRLMRTGISANTITLITMALGLMAGIVCARGGWRAAVAGVLLLELGSVLDGCDGELARLKYQGSRLGEWLDTVSDDLSNVAFLVGATINLRGAGVTWATPLGAAAITAFVITEAVQYRRLLRAGVSGDLATFGWDVLGTPGRLRGLFTRLAPLVKRDFFVTAFVPLVLVGRLDVVLVLSAAGAFAVLLVLVAQLVGSPWPVSRPA